jgi:hypothetical protein
MSEPFHGRYRSSRYDTNIPDVWCSFELKDKAKRIGKGNISEGVRKALEAFQEENKDGRSISR